MATSVYGPDTFTVGSTTELSAYNSDWAKTNATSINIVADASSDFLRTNGAGNPAYRWNGEALVEQSIHADIHTAGANSSWPGLCVRWAATFAGYLAEWDAGIGDIVIYESPNVSTFNVLAQGGAVAQNTTYTGCYLKIIGDDIEVGDDTNGAAAVTTSDVNHATGQPGISIANDAGQIPWIDNIEIFDEEDTGTTDRRAIVSFVELEVPNEPRRAIVSFTEFEIPNEPRRAIVSFAELEVPNEPRRAIVSFLEFEIPDEPPSEDRRAIVSWVELEVPNEPRRAIVSWSELEVPDEPRRAIVTWLELEIPDEPNLSFVNYGSAFLFTEANWKSNVAAYFEVYMRATSGTVHARLWDITTASIVAGSELSTADTDFERLRSPVITLEDGHEYIVQVGKETGNAGEIKSGRVVMLS